MLNVKTSSFVLSAFLATTLGPQKMFANSDTAAFFHSSWSAVGFVIGYGDHAAFAKYACNGVDPGVGKSCDGPPEVGLVNMLTSKMLKGISDGLGTTCTDYPLSGTKDVTMSSGAKMTVTFAAPKLKIPAAWVGGGTAFDRRLEFNSSMAGVVVKIVAETSCTYPKTGFVAVNIAVGTDAPGYNRPMNVFFGVKDGLARADIYVTEVNTAKNVRGAYGFALAVDEANKTYKLWGAAGQHYSDGSSDKPVDVFNIVGNYSTHQVSLRAKRFVSAGITGSTGGSYLSQTSLESITGNATASLDAATPFNLLTKYDTLMTGQSGTAQGCMDFDLPTVAPTTAAACTGLDWEAAPTPVLDTDGSFSAKWVYGSMHTKLVEIPTL